MGKFRDYRLSIPAALLILEVGFTFFVGMAIAERRPPLPTEWYNLLAVLVGLTVGSFAGGFLCSAPTVFYLATAGNRLGEDLQRLKDVVQRNSPQLAAEISGDRDELLAEAHLRFHSHAPKEVVSFATRRNTAMYVSFNSMFALGFGFLLGLLCCAIVLKASDWTVEQPLFCKRPNC